MENLPKKSNKNLKIAIAVSAAVIFVVVAGTSAIVFGVFALLRNSDAYQTAIAYIEAHPQIAELAGEIESFGRFPTGSVNTVVGGRGDADFTIRVNGTRNTLRVNVRLVREPLRDWEVIDFYYRLR